MQGYFEGAKYLKRCKYLLLFSGLMFTLPVFADSVFNLPDTAFTAVIKSQINQHKNQLRYPLSVMRFYKRSNFSLTWIAPNTVKTHTGDAMMLLDCVVQYGLNHADYHPEELRYDKLNELINYPEKSSMADKAAFDIFLTDALITFINNLHYGKLNPIFTTGKIDAAKGLLFNTDLTLLNAAGSPDFNEIINDVQPGSVEYKNLKYEMYLITGLYILDCYETPEAEIRKMAINMERLRWVENNDKPYILINTANGNLRLHERDESFLFKIVAPKLFPLAVRPSIKLNFITIINGNILVGREAFKINFPNKLGETILAHDNNAFKTKALNTNRNRKIRLKVPVIVNSVYLTCEIIGGTRVFYKDVLNLDKKLESDLYGRVINLAADIN